jgi:hypothetical protein
MSPTHLFGSRLRLAAVFRGAWLAGFWFLCCDFRLEGSCVPSVLPFSFPREPALPSRSHCLSRRSLFVWLRLYVLVLSLSSSARSCQPRDVIEEAWNFSPILFNTDNHLNGLTLLLDLGHPSLDAKHAPPASLPVKDFG